MRGGKTVVIEPHRHPGVFIARGKEDALVTLNLVPGDTVYGEKKVTVEVIIKIGKSLKLYYPTAENGFCQSKNICMQIFKTFKSLL